MTKAAEQNSVAIIAAMVFYVSVNVGSDVHAFSLRPVTDPVASLQRSLAGVIQSMTAVQRSPPRQLLGIDHVQPPVC